MATALKVLGQLAPAATTETTLYTVPAATSAVVSTIVVANRSTTGTTFRISIAVGGGATATKDYIAYNVVCEANETMTFTLGVTLATTDKIKVFAGSANLSFNAFGQETT